MRRTVAVLALFSSLPLAARGEAPPPVLMPLPPKGFPEAQPPLEKRIPDWRLVFNNLTVFRYNPLGLEDQLRAGLQRRLFHSFDALFRDTFVFVGIAPRLNPAYVKLGPSIEIQPLSIFNLRLAGELVEWFGTFGYLSSFTSPLENYSDTALDRLRDANQNYNTSGVHFMIEPTLQVKFGSIAIRDKLAVEFWNVTLRDGDTVFYDATLDTLVAKKGWVMTNDLDVLYLTKFGLTVGARYTTVRPFYPATAYAAGQDVTKNENTHQRLGAIIAYTFFDHGFTRFNKPTVLVIASWYLEHRFRTGLDTGPYNPYLVVGFAFQSDLLGKGP